MFILALFFIVPFIGAGCLLGTKFIEQLQSGAPVNEQLIGTGAGAAVFLLVGFGMLVGMIVWKRQDSRKEEIKKRYPDAPWRWRSEWRDGKVYANTKGGVIGIWALAIFWNAISTPVFFIIPEEVSKGNYVVILFGLFPLFGLLFIWAAIHSLLHYWKFGKVVFEMSSFPARLGQSLRGSVQIPVKVELDKDIKLELQNIHVVTTGTGKQRQTKQTVVWNKEVTIPKQQTMNSSQKTLIPVSFEIPSDARPTPIAGSNNYFEWKLIVTGSAPGIDLSLNFAVPVFGQETELTQVFETTDESDEETTPSGTSRF